MKLLGVPIKHPSLAQLALAALMITMAAGIGIALQAYGLVRPESVWPTLIAFTSGVLLSAFGISITEHGWRAVILMIAATSVIYFLI